MAIIEGMKTMDEGRQLRQAVEDVVNRAGALDVGYAMIRQAIPTVVMAFPYSAVWLPRRPLALTRKLGEVALASNQALSRAVALLQSAGYAAHGKGVLSVYGDFRPLAAAAGLGGWGRNGLIVHPRYGSGLLFTALFTNAPLTWEERPRQGGCRACGECVSACPAGALDKERLHLLRCLGHSLQGCGECMEACKSQLFHQADPIPKSIVDDPV